MVRPRGPGELERRLRKAFDARRVEARAWEPIRWSRAEAVRGELGAPDPRTVAVASRHAELGPVMRHSFAAGLPRSSTLAGVVLGRALLDCAEEFVELEGGELVASDVTREALELLALGAAPFVMSSHAAGTDLELWVIRTQLLSVSSSRVRDALELTRRGGSSAAQDELVLTLERVLEAEDASTCEAFRALLRSHEGRLGALIELAREI